MRSSPPRMKYNLDPTGTPARKHRKSPSAPNVPMESAKTAVQLADTGTSRRDRIRPARSNSTSSRCERSGRSGVCITASVSFLSVAFQQRIPSLTVA